MKLTNKKEALGFQGNREYGNLLFTPKCEGHPVLKVGRGEITGGKDKVQRNKAKLWVALDDHPLRIEVLDSAGELTKIILPKNQRLIYMPVMDRHAPTDMALLGKILGIMHVYIEMGKRVHVSCIGGHGRTGTLIALYIGKYQKVANPVEWVRENYCKEAIESWEQHLFIHEYLGLEKPDQTPYTKVINPYEWNDFGSRGGDAYFNTVWNRVKRAVKGDVSYNPFNDEGGW